MEKTEDAVKDREAHPRDGLPYDPVDWTRRLERARESRARILAERAARENGAEGHGADGGGPLLLARPIDGAEGVREPQAPDTGRAVPGRATRPVLVLAGLLFGLAAGVAIVGLFPGG